MTKLINFLHRALAVLAGVALVLMLLLAVVDMVMRTLGWPIPGSYEIIGWLAAISMGAALAYTQAHKGHVAIDLLINLLPVKVRRFTEACVYLLSTLLITAAAYQLFNYGADMQASGSSSETLRAPVHPWVYALATALAVFALVLVKDFVESVRGLFSRSGERVGAPEGARS
jgi:TRAP-type C4-dicarboxylate transport system permease small subunit